MNRCTTCHWPSDHKNPEDLAEFAESLRERIASTPVQSDGVTLSVTASFGVANRNGCGLTQSVHLLKAADDALYQAKKLGRNRVEVAPPPKPS